ncbi:MAG: 50S ribosomal protein L28 [Patescibacteria group bacterium]
MAQRCFKCNKGVMYGHKVSHAKNRTRRLFKPNLHYVRIAMDNARKRVRLCTKCLRMIKKETKEKTTKPQTWVAPVAAA